MLNHERLFAELNYKTLIFLGVSSWLISSSVFYLTYRDGELNKVMATAEAIAKTASMSIDSYEYDLAIKRLSRDPNGLPSSELSDFLLKLKATMNLSGDLYLYSQSWANPEKVIFVALSSSSNAGGDELSILPHMRAAMVSSNSGNSSLYNYKQQRWISGYAPIKDSHGKVLGFLEVPYKVDSLFAEIRESALIFSMKLGCLIFLTFCCIVLFEFYFRSKRKARMKSKNIREQLYELTHESQVMGDTAKEMLHDLFARSDRQLETLVDALKVFSNLDDNSERSIDSYFQTSAELVLIMNRLKNLEPRLELLNTLLDQVQSNESATQLKNKLNEIYSKTKTIDDVVFKTQMLAVNAAIEAVKAGDEGEGFSVVADEISGMAEKSGGIAESIQNLIFQTRTLIEEIDTQKEGSVVEIKAMIVDLRKLLLRGVTDIEDIVAEKQKFEKFLTVYKEHIQTLSPLVSTLQDNRSFILQDQTKIKAILDSLETKNNEIIFCSRTT